MTWLVQLIVKFVFIEKQMGQGAVNRNQLIVLAGRGSNSEDRLEMAGGPLSLAPGMAHPAKDVTTLTTFIGD